MQTNKGLLMRRGVAKKKGDQLKCTRSWQNNWLGTEAGNSLVVSVLDKQTYKERSLQINPLTSWMNGQLILYEFVSVLWIYKSMLNAIWIHKKTH